LLTKIITREGVFKCLAILHFFKKKVYFLRRKKEELWKLKYISPCKNILIFLNHTHKKKKKKKNQPNMSILKRKMLVSMTILFFEMPSELLQQIGQ
jgi:hypothetical protein